jgi:Ca-activated chloride channel family protein
MPKQNYLCIQRSQPGKGEKPFPAQMQEMYAKFNAWKEKFQEMIDSAESYYNQGNTLAKAGKFPAAVASFQEALKRRPDWPEVKANLALAQRLIPKEKKDDESEEGPNLKPDEIKFDDKGEKGKRGEVELGKQTAEMWMRNIQTTPAQLLQRKFALQAQEVKQ